MIRLAQLTPQLVKQNHYRAHAKKLDQALSEVETHLPGPLSDFLFNPLQNWTDDGLRAKHARFNAFAEEVKRMRRICARAMGPGIGLHPNYDHTKHTCAHWAYCLIRELSENKISGTEDGLFRNITSLLYEATTGQGDADLKRACDQKLAGTTPSGLPHEPNR